MLSGRISLSFSSEDPKNRKSMGFLSRSEALRIQLVSRDGGGLRRHGLGILEDWLNMFPINGLPGFA